MRLWCVNENKYWYGRTKEEKYFWDLVEKIELDGMEDDKWDTNQNLKGQSLIEDNLTRKVML